MNIGPVTATATPPSSASSLGVQDFMKILLTQLSFQDPLKPLDNQAFMAQMAQFTALEQSQRLNDRVQQLIGDQAALHSVGLLGRSVDVQAAGSRKTGTVTALSLQGDVPLLTLSLSGGAVLEQVSLAQVLAIH